MKNTLIFLCGMLTGVILMTAINIYKTKALEQTESNVPTEECIAKDDSVTTNKPEVRNKKSDKEITGVSWMDAAGQVMSVQEYKIDSVTEQGYAIARALSNRFPDPENSLYYGIKVLICPIENNIFYDNKIIKAPKGKCFREVGVYKNRVETIPVIALYDK